MLKVRMNQQMKRFNSSQTLCTDRYRVTNSHFTAVLDEGFVEVDHCIVLRHELIRSSSVSRSSFPDKTGYEAFVNHLHIDDYLSDEALKSASTAISTGIAISIAIANELSLHFPTTPFHVIMAVDCEELDISMRFHQQRDGESWLADDIDEYMGEAILVIEVNT